MIISTLGLLVFVLSACATSDRASSIWQGPETIAHIESIGTEETSGLAPSRLQSDILWSHNDSGDQPILRALDLKGNVRAIVNIRGARNFDWEDMASFTLDGVAYLIVGDIGDNNAVRTDPMLYVIKEPAFTRTEHMQTLFVDISWQIPLRYPGGPLDCESIAVDVQEEMIYLISKRTKPAVAYRLPLRATREKTPAAHRVGALNGLREASGLFANMKIPAGKYRGQPCAFDISADGRIAVVLTYGEVYLYSKADGMSWSEAFARDPLVLGSHGLPQAEAICFSRDARKIIFTTEGYPAPLITYTLAEKL